MAPIATTSRSLACSAGLVGLAAMLCAGSVQADPCTVNGSQVPECVVQTDTGSLKGDRSEYMNVYCPASSPYAWVAGATAGPVAGTSSPATRSVTI